MIRDRARQVIHRLTDNLASKLPTPKLFSGGFGDREELERLVARVRDYDPSVALPAPDVSLRRVSGSKEEPDLVGTFRSPAAEILPRESRTGLLEVHAPASGFGPDVPVCLVLAATGDEGFGLRRRLAKQLRARGVASVLLENPFYGSRRPAGQRLSLLRTVEEQFAMNCATVDEARALVLWLHERGHRRIATAGYSQGAMMAIFGAALSEVDVACVPGAGGLRAAPIFVEDALRRRFDWDALSADAGSQSEAQRYFAECLEPVDAGRFPAPRRADAAIIIGARHDQYISPSEVVALNEHWPGSELRWIDTGHLTGALWGIRGHARAIGEALRRL